MNESSEVSTTSEKISRIGLLGYIFRFNLFLSLGSVLLPWLWWGWYRLFDDLPSQKEWVLMGIKHGPLRGDPFRSVYSFCFGFILVGAAFSLVFGVVALIWKRELDELGKWVFLFLAQVSLIYFLLGPLFWLVD